VPLRAADRRSAGAGAAARAARAQLTVTGRRRAAPAPLASAACLARRTGPDLARSRLCSLRVKRSSRGTGRKPFPVVSPQTGREHDMAKVKEKAEQRAEQGQAIVELLKSNPYVQRVLADEDLRNQVRDAVDSSRSAYHRA